MAIHFEVTFRRSQRLLHTNEFRKYALIAVVHMLIEQNNVNIMALFYSPVSPIHLEVF